MKIIDRFVAPCAAAFLLLNVNAFAQPAPLDSSQKTAGMAPLDETNWRAIRVQNARPSLIAYQLDPAHNALPAFFNVPGSLAENFRQGDAALKVAPKGPFEGVHLIGADEQKLLFFSGKSDAQIAELREMVALLDKAERFVTLQAQLVEMPVAQWKQFGIDTSTARGNFDMATPATSKTVFPETPGQLIDDKPVAGVFQVGFVRNDFQARLDALAKSGKAEIFAVKPLKVGNNSSQSVSLLSGPIDNTGANQYKMPTAPAGGKDTIITLTPTINGDDTITVLMNVAALSADAKPSGLTSVVNVRDGDTIALMGLAPSALPGTAPKARDVGGIPFYSERFSPKQAANDRVMILFLSARIAK